MCGHCLVHLAKMKKAGFKVYPLSAGLGVTSAALWNCLKCNSEFVILPLDKKEKKLSEEALAEEEYNNRWMLLPSA